MSEKKKTDYTKTGIDWGAIGTEEKLVIFNEQKPKYRLRIDEYSHNKMVKIADKDVAQWTFLVTELLENESLTWNITSKRLMRQLKNFEPLIGKGLLIKKKGSGFDTTYILEEILPRA